MWVLIEHREGEIAEASLEVLSEARRLASKSKHKVSALILGHSGTAFAEPLAKLGANNIYFVDHGLLKTYTTEAYTAALTELLKRQKPEIFLLAATALGRDLAPRLATRLQTGFVSDCTVLDISSQGVLEMTRPSCAGRVYVTMSCPSSRPQIATVRPGVLGVGKRTRDRPAAVEELFVDLHGEMIRTRTLGTSTVAREKLDLTEAEVVLAFGRGVGDRSMLPQFEELARLLHASLGGSRAAVDERYISFDRQIGQTGKTISPKVVICCGISGAQQFTMGMRDSKFIVAINTDRNAPIFRVADVSVLGDLHAVIPELIERVQALTGTRS